MIALVVSASVKHRQLMTRMPCTDGNVSFASPDDDDDDEPANLPAQLSRC